MAEDSTNRRTLTAPPIPALAAATREFGLPDTEGLRSFYRWHKKHVLVFSPGEVSCTTCAKTWRRP